MTVNPPPKLVPAPVMLIIGDIGRWEANGRDIPSLDHCIFASFEELGPALMAAIRPSYVISALIAGPVDAMDIAARLAELGFEGSYRTIADKLPNVGAVKREIQAVAPSLDFDILELGGDAPD